jgi:hypothetical protein
MNDRNIDAWKKTDIVDTERFDDAYFDGLADRIDAAVDASHGARVVSLRSARRARRGFLLAAAAALAWALLPSAPSDPPFVDIADDALARELAEDLVPAALDELEEDLTARSLLAAALEADYGLTQTEDDTLASAGSWMAELDDLTPDELARLAARL